jgi:hypothetical protein
VVSYRRFTPRFYRDLADRPNSANRPIRETDPSAPSLK